MTKKPPGPRRDDRDGHSLGELDVVRRPDEHDALALWTKLGLACLFLKRPPGRGDPPKLRRAHG